MSNPDTQNMIDRVERQTGYRVTVDVISGIVDMISAQPENPAHIIRVNADRRQYANYIVAVQYNIEFDEALTYDIDHYRENRRWVGRLMQNLSS